MTHNEERAHWIKEGAIGLGGKFIQYLSVELEVKYSCQSRLDKECYCYPNLNEIIVTPSPHYKATVCAKNVS
jgi:hypothetical protein